MSFSYPVGFSYPLSIHHSNGYSLCLENNLFRNFHILKYGKRCVPSIMLESYRLAEVLLDSEHVNQCSMSFWTWTLRKVTGFDPMTHRNSSNIKTQVLVLLAEVIRNAINLGIESPLNLIVMLLLLL